MARPNNTTSPSIEIPRNPWIPRLTAWAFAFTGFVLSAVAAGSCEFFKLTQFLDADSIVVDWYGLYSYQESDGICVSISLLEDNLKNNDPPEEFLDSNYKVARAFGVLAAALGGVIMLLMLLQLCCRMNKVLWWTFSFLLILNMVFQGLTFLVFNWEECTREEETDADGVVSPVNVKCELDEGANVAVAAMCMYLIAGILVIFSPFPDAPLFKLSPNTIQTVRSDTVIERSVKREGADLDQEMAEEGNEKRTVTETINPDGSKTTYITTTYTAPAPSPAPVPASDAQEPPVAQANV